jgi:hypothetical protein
MEICIFINVNYSIICILKHDNIQCLLYNKKGIFIKNNNTINVLWNNGEKEFYYKINKKFYTFEYIINKFKTLIIKFENNEKFIMLENKVHSLYYENLVGNFEINNNLLIINWGCVKNYYYRNDSNIYISLIVPNFFDCNFYLKNINNYTEETKNNWDIALFDYFTNGQFKNISYIHYIKIIFNDILQDAIMNETHQYVLINDSYYKYNIDNNNVNIIHLYINSFIFSNNTCIFNYNYETKYNKYILINNILFILT